MGYSAYETSGQRRIGPIGKTLLAVTVLAAIFLLYHATWAAVILVGLAHDVPSRWTLSDFALIGLPISILAVAAAAVLGLVRGHLLPLWVCLGLLAFDVVVLVTSFE